MSICPHYQRQLIDRLTDDYRYAVANDGETGTLIEYLQAYVIDLQDDINTWSEHTDETKRILRSDIAHIKDYVRWNGGQA